MNNILKHTIIYLSFFVMSCSNNQKDSSGTEKSKDSLTQKHKIKPDKKIKKIPQKITFEIPADYLASGFLTEEDAAEIRNFSFLHQKAGIPFILAANSRGLLFPVFTFNKQIAPSHNFSCFSKGSPCFYTYSEDFKINKTIKVSTTPANSYLNLNFKKNKQLKEWAKRFPVIKKLRLAGIKIKYQNQALEITLISLNRKVHHTLRNAVYYWIQLAINERARFKNKLPYGKILITALKNISVKEKKNKLTIKLNMDLNTLIWTLKQIDSIHQFVQQRERGAK